MFLMCKCGHQWDYQGKALHHAICPKCKAKIPINSNQPENLNLEEWAGTAPIEISIPQTKNEAMAETQEYAQKLGEPSLANFPTLLLRTIRKRHSNYSNLVNEMYNLARAQDATPDEIRDAVKILTERVDTQINDLMRSTWV